MRKYLSNQKGLVLPLVLLVAGLGLFIITRVFAQTTDTTDPTVSTPQFSDFYLLSMGTVLIEPTIVDESPIAKVQLAFHDPQNPINGGLSPEYTFVDQEAPFQFSWDTTKIPDGRQRFNLKAWDVYGNGDNTSFGSSLMVMNDPSYPPISIVSPIPDSIVSGVVPIEVSTSANYGIVQVHIAIEEVSGGGFINKFGPLISPPYRFNWDSKSYRNGKYRFRVRSFEHDRFSHGDLGDPGELIFGVTVNNVSTSPTPFPTISPSLNPTPSPTQSSYGTITGTIFSSTGKLVTGAKITLRVSNKNITYISDAQGKYTIPNLPPGSYLITYVSAGYSQQKTTAIVSAGQTLVINVTLNPK